MLPIRDHCKVHSLTSRSPELEVPKMFQINQISAIVQRKLKKTEPFNFRSNTTKPAKTSLIILGEDPYISEGMLHGYYV